MPLIRFPIAAVLLILVEPSMMTAGEPQDIGVCEALAHLGQHRNNEVQLVGILQGTFYHGFGLLGRPNAQPCSPPLVKWLPPPQALGFVTLQVASKDELVPIEFKLFEQAIASRGILVRANGVLRTPWLSLTLCLDEERCFGNGYYQGRSPALLELRSIQVIDPKAAVSPSQSAVNLDICDVVSSDPTMLKGQVISVSGLLAESDEVFG